MTLERILDLIKNAPPYAFHECNGVRDVLFLRDALLKRIAEEEKKEKDLALVG